MGLDMYLMVADREIKEPYGFTTSDYEDDHIAYFRKHPDLHRWMENLYVERGGEIDKQFGSFCTTLLLTEKDLDRLEEDTKNDRLPKNEGGFFFGESRYPEDKVATLRAIRAAREAIKLGKSVYYDSSW